VSRLTIKRIAFSLLLLVLATTILGGLIGFYSYSTAKSFQPDVQRTRETASVLLASFQSRDLIGAKAQLETLKDEVETMDKKIDRLSWAKATPFLGVYISDAKSAAKAAKSSISALEELIKAIEPYADLVGFKAEAAKTPAAQSVEDKVIFVAETLNKITPQLETISQQVNQARSEFDKISPNRYPDTFLGKNIGAKTLLLKIRDSLDQSSSLLAQSKPLLKILPDLMGNPNPKIYMILFQNDAELRPTGGFMTAYAFLKVTKGKIEPMGSYDIYDLDARFSKNIPAPDPIRKYLEEKRWYIRNMNLNPDYKISMDVFNEALKNIGGLPPFDGIIAIDTQFPVELLKVIGPIGVGGWGNFSAANDPRCDCPQVVYALEEIADRPVSEIRIGRKAVLGPLMHSMLANAMGSPKHLWPKLFNIGIDAIKNKHLLFYFKDEKIQLAAEDFNAAGRIRDFSGDYLHINDTNFGGAKTDMFITREVEQDIENTPEKTTKTVTVIYNNPYKGSNCNLEAGKLCLNGTYRDWIRFYLPKGSKLLSLTGSETKEIVGEELGKTVVEGFFTMRPQSTSKVTIKYELPSPQPTPYKILIQKQPGQKNIKHTIMLNGRQTIVDVNADTELTLN